MGLIEPFQGKQLLAYAPPAPAEIIVFEGAVRSSKTIVSLAYWCKFLREAAPGNLLMVGNTIDSLIRNVLEPLSDMLGSRRVRWSRSTGEAEILGRSVYIMGAHDEQARKRIQGLTLIGAYVDEVAGMPESFWDMLTTRTSELGAQLIATCNPEGPKHWLLKWLRRARWWVRADSSWEERSLADTVRIGEEELPVINLYRVTFVLEDNHWLIRTNPGFVARLKASLTGVFYARNIESRWVSADGMLYPEFSEESCVIDLAQLPRIESTLIVGADYGTNHRTRAYALGLGRVPHSVTTGLPTWGEPGEGGTELRYCLFVLSEFAPDTATVGEHARLFDQWLLTLSHYPPPDWIAVDPAAATFKAELFSRGHSNVMNAHNAVVSGIQIVQSLFAVRRLFILRSCQFLIDAIPGGVWDSKATERGETRPLKENDDELDALRYSVYTSRRDWRDLIPLAALDTPDSDAE